MLDNVCFPFTWNKLIDLLRRVLETVHVALCIEVLYSYFVVNYGSPENLQRIDW